nr:hypothetical protein [Nocardioides convexus]
MAERALLALVPDHLLRTATAADGDALTLAIHDLPHLRTIEGVRVVEEERPDFREIDEAPEIRFDLVETDDERGSTDWFDLAVTVRVAEEGIPLPDVLAALTLGNEYLVLPSGRYVTTDRPEFDRLREVVAAAAEPARARRGADRRRPPGPRAVGPGSPRPGWSTPRSRSGYDAPRRCAT